MSRFLYNGPLEELEGGHSTGPKTPQGKANSSQNATKHGCCSKRAVIKGESEEEFEELVEDWMEEYGPRGKSARMLVEGAVEAQWAMRRNTNRYHELEQSLQEKTVLEWTEEDHKQMERFLRYRTTAERSFTRAVNTLEQVCKRRERREAERKQEQEGAGGEKHIDRAEGEAEAEIEEEIETGGRGGGSRGERGDSCARSVGGCGDREREGGDEARAIERAIAGGPAEDEAAARAGVPESSFQGWDTGRIWVVL